MVLIERLPTAMATMLLPLTLTLAPLLPAAPLACIAALLMVAFTDVRLYCTLVMEALAVLSVGANALTTTLLLAELP